MAITTQYATYKIYTTIGADTGWFPIHFDTSASSVGVVAPEGAGYGTSRQFVTGALLDKLNLAANSAGAFATINSTQNIGGSSRNVLPELNIPHTWLYPLTVEDAIHPDKIVFPNDSVGSIQTPIPGDETNYFGINFSAQDADNLSVNFYGVDSLTWSKTPTAPSHLTNKAYVDMVAGYGVNPLTPVKVTTTAPITLSGAQTIDYIPVANPDRVLVKNQVDHSQDGIYIVNTGAWTRATDADSAAELYGALVVVEQGSSKGFTYYQSAPIDTVGTSAQSWILFNNIVSFYSADNSTLELVGTEFRIKDAGITAAKLGGGIISTSHIASNAAIDFTKLAKITPDDTTVVTQSNAERYLHTLVQALVAQYKKLSGESDWYKAPTKSLLQKQNKATISAEAPTNPVAGDIWIDI